MKKLYRRGLGLLLALLLALTGAAFAEEQPDIEAAHIAETTAADGEPTVDTAEGASAIDETMQQGVAYHEEKDYEKAYEIFRKAAEQNDGDGCMWVGYYYENGHSVEKDLDEAARWYEKAFALGNAYSGYRLGIQAEQRDDYAAAVDYLTQASELGYEWASLELGQLYYQGKKVEGDLEKAKLYIEKVAATNDAEVMHCLGELYERFTDIEYHERIAMSWYEQSALLGNAASMYHMGNLCAEGIAVTKDLNRAAEWYQKAIDNGNTRALPKLYTLYANPGELYDIEKAAALRDQVEANYLQKIENGDASGAMEMGDLYIENDRSKALSYYEKAAELGTTNTTAYDWIGYLYANEASILDYEKSVQAFQKAIELGSGYAMYNIGAMYRDGNYFEQDQEKAEECFQKARDMGFSF